MTAEIEQQSHTSERRWIAIIALALIVVGAVTAVFIRLRQLRAADRADQDSKVRMPHITPATGLSDAEAEARQQPDIDNVLYRHPRRSRRQIIRASTFTIFNLNLIALSVAQLLMGSILSALMTIGVLLLNVGLNVFQEEFARFRLRDLLAAARPQATVIRSGQVRTIDPNDIVVGDVLAGGPGDQILVDGIIVGEGEIVLEERLFEAELRRLRKRAGDALYAGSICTSGHATYEVKAVGPERQIVQHMQDSDAAAVQLTPIEKILSNVMRVLLVVTLLFGAILLLRYFSVDIGDASEVYIDAANVIFNIAPASLFFMVVLTYVGATADLGKIGALVQDSRSVESLADVDTICFAQEGILAGTNVTFDPFEEEVENQALAESRVRQVLGDCAASGSSNSPVVSAIAASFPGDRRLIVDEAAFLSVYGWSGIVFDDEDLRGVYVLAVPAVLADLQKQTAQVPGLDREKSIISRGAASLARPFSRLFGRGKKQEEDGAEHSQTVASETGEQGERNPQSEAGTANEGREEQGKETSAGLFGRFRHKVSRLLPGRKQQPAAEEEQEEEEAPATNLQLTFAYSPTVASINSGSGEPRLPSDLILLGTLTFQERIHPDAVPAILQFSERDVSVDIFTLGLAQNTIEMLGDAGLPAAADNQIPSISGPELAALEAEELTQAALDNRLFGQVSPRQTEQIVRVLHQAKRSIGVVADSAGDVNALRQGDLAITRGSSSPAALSQADIIIIGDSPAVLPRVVDKGQRIVNGLLDVLKLYLTQSVYLVLLLIAIPLLVGGFPYTSAQGGMIALFTLTLPAFGLSLWSKPGQLQTSSLTQVLARFILPAAITMAAAGMIVYAYFLELDGTIHSAQIALTHMLISMGLMLVLFIQPPVIIGWGKRPRRGNLAVTVIVIISAGLFFLATQIPLTQELLQLDPLQEPAHYIIILGAALLWALILRLVWFLLPVERPVWGTIARDLEGDESL